MAVALSKTAWTEAALSALARDGLHGVAVEPLARRLGATKGSFYWHFADRSELIAATLHLWEQRETADVIERIRRITEPHERLGALAVGAYAAAAGGNAHAALLASASNPQVRVVLDRVTQTRLAFLRQLYQELGVAADSAEQHARVAYALYLGIGELHRAALDGDSAGEEDLAYLALAVDKMMPSELRASRAVARPLTR